MPTENIFKKIRRKKFPDLKKELSVKVKTAYRTPNRPGPKKKKKKNSSRHIIIKKLNEKYKQSISKLQGKKMKSHRKEGRPLE
jgi:hypothetical protein